MDKIEMDAPFMEARQNEIAMTRSGDLVQFDFMERRIDLSIAKPREVLRTAFNEKNSDLAFRLCAGVASSLYGCIYFIGPTEGSPLKIGISLNPFQRLMELQIGNWIELSIQGLIWVKWEDAERIEKAAHKIAAQSDMMARGEWAWATIETAVEIVIEAAQKKKLPLYTPAMVVHNQGMAMLARDKAGPEDGLRFHIANDVKKRHILKMVSRA